MKKLLSMVAALALLLALAVPALADSAVSSITYAQDGDVQITDVTSLVEDVNGEDIEMKVTEITEADLTDEQKTTLLDTVNTTYDDAIAVEVVDVSLHYESDGSLVEQEVVDTIVTSETPVTVTFLRDDATHEVIGVLYWNHTTGQWDEAEFITDGSTVTATFEHLCAIAFVLKEISSGGSTSGGTSSGTGTGTGSATSPQTGYNTAGWTAAIVVLLLGAGYCFVSARKKTEE
ncbi:MAG: hypothetical protein LUH42_04995 [Oscillospiraceae bacterium]|nr:hypothetical protein [Oscillospiraceae bacterium]